LHCGILVASAPADYVRQAKRLGGRAIHGHLKFCRKLYREIARLLAVQNAIDIGGDATKEVYPVGSVGEQTAVLVDDDPDAENQSSSSLSAR
jgi:hypothetical protein